MVKLSQAESLPECHPSNVTSRTAKALWAFERDCARDFAEVEKGVEGEVEKEAKGTL